MSRANEAFITMLAGYQLFKPKTKNSNIYLDKRRTSSSTTSGKGLPVNLWYNESVGKHREGLYVGNRIFFKYADPVGSVNKKTDLEARRTLQSGQGLRGDTILNNFFPEMIARLKTDGLKIPLPKDEKGVSAASERMAPIGLGVREQRQEFAGADPVDVVFNKKGYQTSFTALTASDHHGLYGRGHDAMVQDFKSYTNRPRAEKHQAMGNRALSYYKDRLLVWNRAMKQAQGKALKKPTASTANRIRNQIAQMGGGMSNYRGFQIANTRGFRQMAGNVTGYINKTAASFIRTALGKKNFGNYSQGVTYAFPLSRSKEDRYVNVHLSYFKLFNNKGFIQFDRNALNKATIIGGHDAMSATLAAGLSEQNEYSVAANQFHAQIASEAKVEGETRYMSMVNAERAGGTVAKFSKRIYPSIDLVAANKQMSMFLKTFGVKRVKNWFKSYTNRNDSKFVDSLGDKKNIMVDNKKFWALPYISFADYDERRFG
tara:strand:+ start:548 stop:2008 length:1461 start_codon:yes stop_codon:yes gene_type:complete